MNKLEDDFIAVYKTAMKEINPHLEAASNSLKEAEKIAEQYGIPFSSYVNFCSGNGYVPKSIKEKFPGIDESMVSSVASLYANYELDLDYGGWIHSSMC